MHTDIAIVGAGPAGTAAAITARQAGLRVVLLEHARFPRDRPGETLHPGVESLLQRLGVWSEIIASAGYLRHPGVWIHDRVGVRFEPYGGDRAGPWWGLQAPRADLDSRLLHAAARFGAEVRQPCKALYPLRKSGRVVGVETDAGPIAARWTFDAGGGRHWLARHLRIPIRSRSPVLVARYGYAQGHCSALDGPPVFRVDPDGWTWTTRIRAGLYHWTRVRLSTRSADPPAEFRSLDLVGRRRGEVVTWRYADSVAARGLFLLGDAAAVFDPSASNGVLRAIMSGIMAAHIVVLVARGRLPEAAAFAAYQAWFQASFDARFAEMNSWYRSTFPAAWRAAERTADQAS